MCIGQGMILLDNTIVNVALPSIQRGLRVTPGNLEWTINAYVLALASLIILGGTLGDRYGRRRFYLVGLVGFTVCSAACGLAQSGVELIVYRGLQGIGAAMLAPLSLSILVDAYPPEERPTAIGIWASVAGLGFVAGPIVGGLLINRFDWPAVFWVNVPIGAVVLAALPRLLPSGTRRRDVRPDLPGALATTVALGLLVYGLTSAGEHGPAIVTSWLPLLLAGCVTAWLVRHLRRSPDPLLPPWLLRSRAVAGACVTALALTASTTPAMYLSTVYVQRVLELPPARAALLFPAFNVAVIAGSLAGPGLLRRLGARQVALAGFGAIAAGTVLLAALPAAGRPVGQLLAAFAVMGAGLGAAAVASTHVGTEAPEPAHQGVASGVLNAAAQVGTALGLAVLAPVAGYRTGFVGAGLLALAGLATALLLPGARDRDARGPRPPMSIVDDVPRGESRAVGE